jgi:DNA polymerase-3 subunit delta
MPVLILAGDEEFELWRRVQHLKEELLDPAWASVNFLKMDNPGIAEIINAAGSLPFGFGKKVILFDRCDLFTKKKSKGGDSSSKADDTKGKDKLLDELEKALAAVSENTHVIFACPFNFDSTLKTAKACAKQATLETFAKEKFWVGSFNPKLATWCRKEAKHHGATIEDDAITYLLDGTEANLRQISLELEKAAIHILPDKHITLKTVVSLSPYHSHVFVLADRWLSGKGKEALVSADEMTARQSAMPLIATFQTMISKWIQIKALTEKYNRESGTGPGINRRELPSSELVRRISSELKAAPMVVEKDLKRLSKVPLERLIEKRKTLTRLEASIKTGLIPDAHALQIFLAG